MRKPNSMKEKSKRLDIVITPEISKKLNEGNYNKNKLIINLLKKFLAKKEKNITSLP
jgi:hypothetical protein